MTAQIGLALERREDDRFLTGSACFVDDIQREGLAHAHIVRSMCACANIKSIDTAEARAVPGVIDIITSSDLTVGLKHIPLSAFTPLPGFERFLQKPFAEHRSVYVGEPLAIIIAESRYIAEDAAELIFVDYEQQTAVVSASQSLLDQDLVHPDAGTNLATFATVSKGDVESAFAHAAYTRKERFSVHRHTAAPLETRGLVAEWDSQRAHLQVWGATKLTFRNREILADMLGLQEAQIDMIEVDVGGAFGVRGEFYPEDFLVPYAAIRVQRPVKWIEDRAEHLLATNHSRQMECEVEIAVDKDGMIVGLRGELIVDMGAYVRPNGGVAPGKGLQFLCGPYQIKNARFELRAALTNKTPFGSYRGPGRYESSYFRERIVDLAAHDLGIEPSDFRMRNLIKFDQMPWNAGAMVPGGPVAFYDTGNYPVVLEQALELTDYSRLREKRGKQADGRYYGLGIACFVESGGGGPSESARVSVSPEGRLELYTGISATGQGHETVFAQVLADELAVPLESIDFYHGSTMYVKRGWGTYHSRGAVMGGSAIVMACSKIKDQLRAFAAEHFDLQLSELVWNGGILLKKDQAAPLVSTVELIRLFNENAGTHSKLEAEAVYSSSELTYTFGVQFAHVAIDIETAVVEVLRFNTVEDVGRMLNPAVVHGQTIGAAVQGLGGTMLDHLVYDDSGQLLSGSFADYLMPTATDFPCVDATSLEISKATNNLLGVKGAGEGGIAAVGGAVANAVDDALRSFSVVIRDLPITPDRLAALLDTAANLRGNSLASSAQFQN